MLVNYEVFFLFLNTSIWLATTWNPNHGDNNNLCCLSSFLNAYIAFINIQDNQWWRRFQLGIFFQMVPAMVWMKSVFHRLFWLISGSPAWGANWQVVESLIGRTQLKGMAWGVQMLWDDSPTPPLCCPVLGTGVMWASSHHTLLPPWSCVSAWFPCYKGLYPLRHWTKGPRFPWVSSFS